MKISTKGRYAIRFLLDLAENQDDGYVSVRDISARQNISRKYLEQILPLLSGAGILKASRGANGGYRLLKMPKDYKIGSILRITERNLAPVSCLETDVIDCDRAENCQTLPMWKGLYKIITSYLDAITLQDLIDGKAEKDMIIDGKVNLDDYQF
ncbi:MAG: Rrf2 family transcriptional regulator [Ruminococcus callidus]|nr:Rrf2 family transcriptional regulator [Ruminococcus callidus]